MNNAAKKFLESITDAEDRKNAEDYIHIYENNKMMNRTVNGTTFFVIVTDENCFYGNAQAKELLYFLHGSSSGNAATICRANWTGAYTSIKKALEDYYGVA